MPVSSVTEHWIKPDAVTINLNHFGDPDYLQVSVLAGAVVMAFKQDVIAYNAAHNYRTWPLQAANTYLETASAYNVYARLTRSEVNASALIVYDPILRDIEGRPISHSEKGEEVLGEADPTYFYVFLGQISSSIGSSGQSISREWTVDFRFGSLDTSQYRNEESGGEWQKMFRLNKVTDMIDVLKTFSSAVFKRLFIGEKEIQDVQRASDETLTPRVDDLTIPTTQFNENRFLSKKKDDRTPYNLGVGKNLTVGGDVVSEHFANGTIKGGYAIRKNEDGEYDMESDNIIARILAKTYDLLVQNHATFVGNLSSEEFISGFIGGKGWSIRMKEWLNAAGVMEKKSVAEFDDLIVRGSMRVFEFIVSQLLGENDNRVFTGMMEVDHYDASDGRIYLKTDGGKLYNPFRVDDVIIVQQYGQPTEDDGYYVTKQYEFVVTDAKVGNLSDGEDRLDWITFSNFTTPIEGGSESLIAERDTLVRIDNLTNNDRKGIIQMMSAGKDTPYMDIIYGRKTDPDNSLKGRLGNLGGVYNELFGDGRWLRGFGAYLTNLYAVGEFVIAHEGLNVSDVIKIAKGEFRTNFRQTTYDLSEEDNFFTNAALTNNCEHWILGSEDGTGYFMVDGLPQFFNFDVYATEDSYAGLVEWKGRDMLRLNKSMVRQLNSLIRKPSTHKKYGDAVMNEDGSFTDTYEEIPNTLYLTVRLYVASASKVELGFIGEDGAFIGNDFHFVREIESNEDAYDIKLTGTWNGQGDFCITATGDVYVDLLSLTDKPLDNFKVETETKFEQDGKRLALLGQKVNQATGTVTELALVVDAQKEQISSLVTKTNAIDNTISSSGWINEADSVRIFSEQLDAQGVATKAEIKVLVQDEVSKIEISADKIDLTGKVTFNDFNQSLQGTINGKVDTTTIISGGYIKSELLDVTEIHATSGSIAGFKISDNNLTNEGFSSDAAIIFKNNNSIAAIGSNVIPMESGANGAAYFQCHTEDPLRITKNYGMVVSAAGTGENVAIGIDGGCVEGFAMKNRIINGSGTIALSRVDYNVIVTSTSACTLLLPEMKLCDDGHVVRIKRLGSGTITFQAPMCETFTSGTTGKNYPAIIYDNGSAVGSGNGMSNLPQYDSCEFVWVRDLRVTLGDFTYNGAWIQYKMPKSW